MNIYGSIHTRERQRFQLRRQNPEQRSRKSHFQKSLTIRGWNSSGYTVLLRLRLRLGLRGGSGSSGCGFRLGFGGSLGSGLRRGSSSTRSIRRHVSRTTFHHFSVRNLRSSGRSWSRGGIRSGASSHASYTSFWKHTGLPPPLRLLESKQHVDISYLGIMNFRVEEKRILPISNVLELQLVPHGKPVLLTRIPREVHRILRRIATNKREW